MAKEPRERFPSAGDLARAATAAASGVHERTAERSVATGRAAPLTPAETMESPPPTEPIAPPEPPPARRVNSERDGPSQRLVLGGIAALIAIAIAAVLALGGGEEAGDDAGRIVTTEATDPSEGEPRIYAGSIPLPTPGFPVGLSIQDREVAVATREGGQLVTIDKRSRKLAGPAVDLGGEGEDVVTTGRFAWVTLPQQDAVARVSLDDGVVEGTIQVGDEPRGIVASSDAIWTADLGSGSITKIDPATSATETTDLEGAEPTDIAFDAGTLWVSDRTGFVIRIDPTGQDRFEVGANPKGIVVDGDVWVANSDDASVSRLNTTGRLEEEIPVGGIPRGLASGFGRIWVANGVEEGEAGYVSAIDPGDTSSPQRVDVSGSPEEIAAGPDRMWVTTGSGNSLVTIDPGAAP
jgi:hypothetical protein